MTYREFIERKTVLAKSEGIKPGPVHESLFKFQADIVRWALRLGRACVWADCGLGKTRMQVSWADQIPGDCLIVAPLAVTTQTIEEAKKIGVSVRYAKNAAEVRSGITITNYQMLHHFDMSRFDGIALDESSILKSFDGKTRTLLIQTCSKIAYRSCWTATPAPNDHMELGNHVEFLGLMSMVEMLSMFFVHDGKETQKWRLKGHAKNDFWRWVSSWAVMMRKPSDLGYDDKGFNLPPLEVLSSSVAHKSSKAQYGFLPYEAQTLPERIQARRESVTERVQHAADIINASKKPFLVWCNLNAEADLAQRLIPGAVQVKGDDSPEEKTSNLTGFSHGKFRVLITKPSIAGHGMNWQHCSKVVFIGLSDSWEQYYQAIRRCWRFGQKNKVTVYIVTAKAEGAVLKNIMRKEEDANRMLTAMLNNMKDFNKENLRKGQTRTVDTYKQNRAEGKGWSLLLGDCVDGVKSLQDESVDFSIFSPPFASLYTHSASPRDLGNCKTQKEFLVHFEYLVKELFRVLRSGRVLSFHCMNLPTRKTRDGFIGISDFRGRLIRSFEKAGFIYHSEAVIWKDPVIAMQRTKAIGLLWKQLKKDSCMSRQGIPDYLVTMRKPGENSKPVGHKPDDFPVKLWQKWASPIWMDINPSDTLQYRSAREHDDERHICPLQLEVIRRAVLMWSRPKDLVLSPFAGIASEGVISLECGRRFVGFELKESYWKQGVLNMKKAFQHKNRTLLPVQA